MTENQETPEAVTHTHTRIVLETGQEIKIHHLHS